MSIYLVRHGQTEFNAGRRLQFPHTPLSEHGFQQAARVAERLVPVAAGAILASDFVRAAQTAESVAAATGLVIEWEPLLQERHFGELRGRYYGELDFDPKAPDYSPPGGEDWPTFDARVARAFEAVIARRARMTQPLIVVSHGLMLGQMLRHHMRLGQTMVVPEELGNTSITAVAATPPYQVRLLNSTEHLAA